MVLSITRTPTPSATRRRRDEHEWTPTHAYLRAVAVGAVVTVLAVVLRRPDVLVLGTPMLLVAGWSAFRRPHRIPTATSTLSHHSLREGEATRWRTTVTPVDGLDHVVGVVAETPYTVTEPGSGVRQVGVRAGVPIELDVPVRTMRWGVRPFGPVGCFGASPWNAFRWTGPTSAAATVTTLPLPAVYDSAAPTPHPAGLVGLTRSARPGEGAEFASIRPFQVGDRLRRIHWPVSARTGRLHVTSTFAEQDSEVVLVVDASSDIGESGGIEGPASSLDRAVRAAGAIAEHYLRRGDRVGLQVFGAESGTVRVPSRAGQAHLRRVLDTLAAIVPDADQRIRKMRSEPVPAGSLVILLSPMISTVALDRAVTLARRGISVVAVDTLPAEVTSAEDDPLLGLAWRIRLLERRREIRQVRTTGVPVVAWQGPGSLDLVLRDVRRRASAPRLSR